MGTTTTIDIATVTTKGGSSSRGHRSGEQYCLEYHTSQRATTAEMVPTNTSQPATIGPLLLGG